MVIISQTGLQCTNSFSFSIIRSEYSDKYLIKENFTDIIYAEYTNLEKCKDELLRLSNTRVDYMFPAE